MPLWFDYTNPVSSIDILLYRWSWLHDFQQLHRFKLPEQSQRLWVQQINSYHASHNEVFRNILQYTLFWSKNPPTSILPKQHCSLFIGVATLKSKKLVPSCNLGLYLNIVTFVASGGREFIGDFNVAKLSEKEPYSSGAINQPFII